jgi:myo-inositol-1(or 4)-monophosphatase
MHPLVNIAVRAARRGGHVLLRNLERVSDLRVGVKGPSDFVSEVDRNAEGEIIEVIRRAYPGHAILAEESGAQDGDEHTWIIDPLDGTNNYLHGLPHFCVSIGVRHRGRIEHGVVYDPLREELFTASRGAGAMLNSRRLRASQRHRLSEALIGTGYPLRHTSGLEAFLESHRELAAITSVRRSGSAALDLAYVGAGRLDGFFELGLHVWDMAAGSLIAREAGAMVSAPDGADDFLERGDVVAANPKLFKLLVQIVHRGIVSARRAQARSGEPGA